MIKSVVLWSVICIVVKRTRGPGMQGPGTRNPGNQICMHCAYTYGSLEPQ